MDELAATGAVDTLDLKGFYRGTPVDVDTDPELYRMVAEGFPGAWIEDPDVTEETRPILDAVSERVTWDAPIHTIADIEERPWRPRTINIKPSRVGPLENLFALYDWAEREGVSVYGGGQTELGVGRDHIQYLASIFHPDTPNDTAPGAYNEPELRDGLPHEPARAAHRGHRLPPRRVAVPRPRRADARREIRSRPQRPDRARVRRLAAVPGRRRLLRGRDPAAPRPALLRPGGRGARPRADDGQVPARPRASGRGSPACASPRGDFADFVEPIAIALEQEQKVTDQISELAAIAREERDFVSEQFVQWFLKEQVEEIDLMSTLLTTAERSRERPLDLEDFIAREGIGGGEADTRGARARGWLTSSSTRWRPAARRSTRWPRGWRPFSRRRAQSLDLALYDVRLPGPAGDLVAGHAA